MTDIEKIMAYAEAFGADVCLVPTTRDKNIVKINNRLYFSDQQGEIQKVMVKKS